MNKKLLVCTVMAVLLLTFCSCSENNIPVSDNNPETTAVEPAPEAEKYTVEFSENEVFSSDISRKAAEHIDPYIKQAVVIMNTVSDHETRHEVLDCDYSSCLKERDRITDSVALEIYDTILEKASVFGDYSFNEDDYSTDNFYSSFVTASDALKTDHRYLYLYTDTVCDRKSYTAGYYMPGKWLDSMTDDREAVKAETAYYDAVADRIIEKMPAGITNYEKCLYFAFVTASVTEYDYSGESLPNFYQSYDALIKQKAVCQGYAEAFYELCRRAGISCQFCYGTTNSGDHAWNKIETAQGPVYIDVTNYDDPEIKDHYRQGWFMYLFMTEDDLLQGGYTVESMR